MAILVSGNTVHPPKLKGQRVPVFPVRRNALQFLNINALLCNCSITRAKDSQSYAVAVFFFFLNCIAFFFSVFDENVAWICNTENSVFSREYCSNLFKKSHPRLLIFYV